MLAELRRLQAILGSNAHRRQPGSEQTEEKQIPRNYKELVRILRSLGLFVDVKNKIAIISKEQGDFIINLLDGTVKISPIMCIKCYDKCQNIQRKLCIIGDSEGWASFNFSTMDLLILSKIFAIYYGKLPEHVLNQIRTKSYCFKQKIVDESVIEELRFISTANPLDNTHFTHAPPIEGPNPPPQLPDLNLRFPNTLLRTTRSFNHLNIAHLKNLMHQELKRLQDHIELSKSIKSSSKSY